MALKLLRTSAFQPKINRSVLSRSASKGQIKRASGPASGRGDDVDEGELDSDVRRSTVVDSSVLSGPAVAPPIFSAHYYVIGMLNDFRMDLRVIIKDWHYP